MCIRDRKYKIWSYPPHLLYTQTRHFYLPFKSLSTLFAQFDAILQQCKKKVGIWQPYPISVEDSKKFLISWSYIGLRINSCGQRLFFKYLHAICGSQVSKFLICHRLASSWYECLNTEMATEKGPIVVILCACAWSLELHFFLVHHISYYRPARRLLLEDFSFYRFTTKLRPVEENL